MNPSNRGPTSRVAVHEARAILERDGYKAERVIGGERLYDLVCLKKDRVLLVAVRSSRILKPSAYHKQIWQLTNMVRDDPDLKRDVEFWIYRSPGWKITNGGAIPTAYQVVG